MRVVWLSALSLSTLLGCAPPGASVPREAEAPCRSDDDCEIASVKSGAGSPICAARRMSSITRWSEKDQAICEPIAATTPAMSEPVLMCFRGTCVPVGSSR